MQAICLKCRKIIPLLNSTETGVYTCKCGNKIPYKTGIYQFVKSDKFYEGKFTDPVNNSSIHGTGIKKILKLIYSYTSIRGNEERVWIRAIKEIRKRTKSKLNILNIGAGGGNHFLKTLGEVTSIDLSYASLMNAKKVSDYCYQADAGNLPFEDSSFDLVFSSHVLGHIPLDKKQNVIKEISRVTKSGGFSLHTCECEANNFIYNLIKTKPKVYNKYFVEMDGHYGLEYPSAYKKRFREAGFKPIFEMSDYCKGIIRPADRHYKVFYDNEEFKDKKFLRGVGRFCNFVYNHKKINLVYDVFIYPLTIFNRLLGPDSVDSVKLMYYKE